MWNEPGFSPLPEVALRVRRMRTGVGVAAVTIAFFAIEWVVRFGVDAEVPLPSFVPATALAIANAVAWWTWSRLSWAAWGWKLDEATFQTRSGVYRRAWKGVPRDRVQFVEVTSGPLQRSRGLATLIVRTAGVRTPAVHVEDLEVDVAETLRSDLSPVRASATPEPEPQPEADVDR